MVLDIIALSEQHRRYLNKELWIGSFINGLFTLVISYFVFREVEAVPLWGENGLAADLSICAFMVTILSGLGMTMNTRKRVNAGLIAPLRQSEVRYFRVSTKLPDNAILRMLVASLAITVACVPFAVAGLGILGATPMPLGPFLVLKTEPPRVLRRLLRLRMEPT